jgi:hypothetical protein
MSTNRDFVESLSGTVAHHMAVPVAPAEVLLSAARDYSFAGKIVTLRDIIQTSPGLPRRGRNRRSSYAVVSLCCRPALHCGGEVRNGLRRLGLGSR